MGRRRAFALGSTVEAKTKGVWMWKGDFFDNPDRALVLLDTEGLYDPMKGSRDHDMSLFAFCLLLSSTLVYNTMMTIDADGLELLHFGAEMVHTVLGDGDGEAELAEHFPALIWAVRDRHLKLEINGEPASPDDYLEYCLQSKRDATRVR